MRKKWTLPKWSMETSLCIWLKVPVRKIKHITSTVFIYMYLYFLTFVIHLRWLPGSRKPKFSKKSWHFASCCCFLSLIMKKYFFITEERNSVFSLFSSWNYLLQRSAIWMHIQLKILLKHFSMFKQLKHQRSNI